jgi:hypothetical protein
LFASPDLPRLWFKANQEGRRKLLLSMLDAVYVDAKKTKSIIAIRPKPPFKPVFQKVSNSCYINLSEKSDEALVNASF